MDIKQNGSTKAEPFHIDKNIITQFENIFQGREDRVGILKGRKPDGKKNQYTLDQAFDAEKHLNLELLQGLEPTKEGQCKWLFEDVDQEVDPKEFCQTLFNLDPKAIPCQSPSGRWHVFKFFHKWFPRQLIQKEAKELEEKLSKLYKVDRGHTLPVKGGWCNLPYARFENFDRKAYDPRGYPLSLKQFIHRVKFKNHPLIAAAAGMNELDGRHKTLFILALYCEHVLKDIKLLEEINNNFADPCSDADVERFTDDEYHKTNEKWTKQYLDNNLENYFEDINGYRPEIVDHLDPKFIQPLDVHTYKSGDQVSKRKWVIEGTCMAGAVTLYVGPGGVGKTTIGSQLCYSEVTGEKFFGKTVFETGNALMIVQEETRNEVNLKLRALEEQFGSLEHCKNKIDIITIEKTVKLTHFKHDGTVAVLRDYHGLKKLIQKNKYKLIYLDPLISLKTGAFDENDNEKMERFIRDYIIPLGLENDCAVVMGHHTNKISGINYNPKYDEKPTVDNLAAMYSARGASSLTAAARFVFALVPMNKLLWEAHYAQIAPQGVRRNDLVGLIEAKSNYSGLNENIFWLEKNIITIDTLENTQEKTNVFTASELTESEEQRFKKHEEINKEKILQQIHHIKSFFKLTSEVIKNIEDRKTGSLEQPLNQLVEYIANRDPEYQNQKIEFKTIKSRYQRLITSIADHPMPIPNTKLQFAYRYDGMTGKVKHKVSIEKEPGDEPWC
jgi:hypothetical protein